MAPFGTVRAIALDLDQTLIDFAASRAAGLDAVLARIASARHHVDRRDFLERHRQLTAAEDTAYLRRGAWAPTAGRFASLCLEFGLPSDGFAEELASLYAETRYANLRQFPEAAAALKRLKARHPLFLVTNGPSASQHREVEVTGVAPYFQRIFVCEDFGLRKPDPRIFDMIREEAGVPPEAMLIVGDFFEADIEVPRELGWRTVWVVRDDGDRARADPARADAVVKSVADVPRLIGL